MARFARVVLTDLPYHLTHRGNRRDDVFFTEERE
jgi:REP element-mobilizing transposase RayT